MSRGTGGVHDQGWAVSGDVDRRGRLARFGDEILVTQNRCARGCFGHDHRLQLGSKPIFHLEAFVAKVMALYKKWSIEFMEMMDD
jgi:hypothetical protein